MWSFWEAGTRKGVIELQKVKDIMDQQLLRKDYSGWCRAIVSFRGDLSIASTGTIAPNRDLAGNQLQALHDLDAHVEGLMFGVVAASDGTASAVFLWRAGDKAPQAFIDSLLKNDNLRLPSLIVQFVFAYLENTYFSNTWWESLPTKDREHLESLANISNSYYTAFRYSDSKFVPWHSVVTATFSS